MAVIEKRLLAIREKAESDLVSFIKLVHPKTVLGNVHEELALWWDRQEASRNQIVLLPRDHQKSRMVAYRVAWHLTKQPWLRVLYISSTSNLAEKQLKFIKDILTSDIFRRYWPDHVHEDEGKRERWTNSEISLDHPLRKEENVRDPSVFTAGLTTSLTGLHCDIAVLDDVVVPENAYTEEGREKVKQQYSLLSSIEGAESFEWVVGTRYHPKDLYGELLEMEEDVFDPVGNIVDKVSVYEKFERTVEDSGDGTGQFLWPRQMRWDGKWFGFDSKILARKRAQYLDRTQFRAQYYNDPNDISTSGINSTYFQYYDQNFLKRQGGYWFFKNERINVSAAIDFAFTMGKRSDYTALVVVGVDRNGNYYILDIDRFKTDKIQDYFQSILRMHSKWGFRKLRAEATAGQSVLIKDLRENYVKPNGISLSVEEYNPPRGKGHKEERIAATLIPRYENGQMWHYRGGNCQVLEEELMLSNPAHDDIKDALANAVDACIAPVSVWHNNVEDTNIIFHPKFGGVKF